jgi:hypothetical protein
LLVPSHDYPLRVGSFDITTTANLQLQKGDCVGCLPGAGEPFILEDGGDHDCDDERIDHSDGFGAVVFV